jgi:hypothetical protein
MNLVAIYLSFIMPLQVHTYAEGKQLAPPYWAVNVVIDTSIILGLANLRNRTPQYNPNPELLLREPDKYDVPKKRRKQLIENYVNNTFLLTTR